MPLPLDKAAAIRAAAARDRPPSGPLPDPRLPALDPRYPYAIHADFPLHLAGITANPRPAPR